MIMLFLAWVLGCCVTVLVVTLLHSWPLALASTPLGGAVAFLLAVCLFPSRASL